jgi:hypothetical protein
MVILGRNAAVAHLWSRNYTGFLAWIAWLAVHIYQLIGFRNRLVVMINWALYYFFFEQAVRVIPPGSRPGGEVRNDEASALPTEKGGGGTPRTRIGSPGSLSRVALRLPSRDFAKEKRTTSTLQVSL